MTSHPGHQCHPSTPIIPISIDGTHIELWCAGCTLWVGGHQPKHETPTEAQALDTYARVVIDHTTATTWTWANPTVTDLEWLAGNIDTIPAVADLLAHRPAVINLREMS